MRPKRIGGVNPAIQLIMAVFLLVVGILMITAPESFIRWLFLIVSVGMAAFGFMSLISAVFGKNGTRLGSLISGILYIVISIVILTQKDFFQAAVSRIFSLLALVQAVTNLISGFLLYNDKVSGYIRKFFWGIVAFGFSVLLFFDPLGHIRAVELISGIYLIVFAVSMALECIDSFLETDYANKKVKPKISLALPIVFAAFIPSRALKYINDKLESGQMEKAKFSKPEDSYGKLEIFIHLKQGLIEGFGHCDFCFDGTVYSYGCYDQHSQKMGGFISGGTASLTKREPYIEHCMSYEEKMLVGFSLDLGRDDYMNLKREIDRMLKQTEVWESDLQIAEKEGRPAEEQKKCNDPASELYRASGASFVKFIDGQYKTYFPLGSNCVMFTYDIMKNAGLDSLAFSGAITPGTYMAHLQDLYEMKNTIVTDMHVYSYGKTKN